MRLLHRSARGDRLVEVELDPDPASVADSVVAELVAALGGDDRHGLLVDGAWYPPSTRLPDLPIREGSLVEIALRSRSAPPPSARVLTVIGGLRAGARHRLDPGVTVSIGRSASNEVALEEPSVSRRHATVDGDDPPIVVDLGSRNGVSIGGRSAVGPTPVSEDTTIRLGATRLAWRIEVDDVPFGFRAGLGSRGGTVPFNRPPRAAPPDRPATLPAPREIEEPAPGEPLSWAGIFLPLVAGALVAALLSPLFAAFAALGPILTIGTWLERRRRSRRLARAERRRLEQELAALGRALPTAREAEIRRLSCLHPDLGEVVRRALGPSVRCWERRPDDPDFLHLVVGTADRPWCPPLVAEGEGRVAEAALAMVRAQPALPDSPVVVALRPGRVIGVVGPPDQTSAIARSLLLQAAVHHGPADVAVAVLTSGQERSIPRWGWARWLPHTTDMVVGRSGGLVAVPREVPAVVESLLTDPSARARLVVIDGADLLTGRSAPARALLSDERVAALVLVSDGRSLPAACVAVVEVVHPAGRVRVHDPRTTDVVEGVVACGLEPAAATDAGRALARVEDPELTIPAADLPSRANLLSLVDLGRDTLDGASVAERWARSRGTADLRAPIGADGHGPLWLDLVADGPHVLVGGTTGSGKSELLRSLVAGLALAADPDHVALVLIDYKGGAAFDRCADLPQVVGLVTDLDDRLAARALRSLEAELRYRELRLRAVGADDLAAFRRLTTGHEVEPLPRLVVVIDEFAGLASDLPDFLHALVGIAQRGRSLGVHLVLATQRPAGVVTEDVRANTSCRIALRVTDRQDSLDVVGSPDAAAITRHRPGRAFARMGPGELVAFQSALVTGRTNPEARVRVVAGPAPGTAVEEATGPTDLERVVEAVRAADHNRGGQPPRPPWMAPLPERIDSSQLHGPAGNRPAAWLLDDPDQQEQTIGGWDPDDGHLLVIGGSGSGKTTTLLTVVLDLCRRHPADALHVHVVDMGAGSLRPLERLHQVGSVVGPTETDRRSRLLRMVDEEIARRRAQGCDRDVAIVLVVDDLGGLKRSHDPVRDPEPHDRLARIWAEGPSSGVTIVVSADRLTELGPAAATTAGNVLTHRTADPGDSLRLPYGPEITSLPVGRAVLAGGLEVQLAYPDPDLVAAVDRLAAVTPAPLEPPPSVRSLERIVESDELPIAARTHGSWVELDFARDHDHLGPVGLVLHRGEHALVAGPPRSGRTNTLAVIGRALGTSAVVVGRPGSELADRLGVSLVSPAALESSITAATAVLLVDDADLLDDSGPLPRLLGGRPDVSVIAAASPERLLGRYGHWAADLRSCRSGVLLRPGPLDGDLLGVNLPPRLELDRIPGRAMLVADGTFRLAQVALLGD